MNFYDRITCTHLFSACAVLALWSVSASADNNESADSMAATLQTMQETLNLQNQRIERIYKAVEPFLEELEREGQQLDEQRARAEAERDIEQPVSNMLNEGDYEAALDTLEQGMQLRQAEALHLQYRLFNLSGCVADWNRCLEVGGALLDSPAFHHDIVDLRNYAVAALLTGDRETYDEVCEQVIAEYGETDDPVVADRTAKLLLLTPTLSPERVDIVLHWIGVVRENEETRENPWYRLVKGIADYRTDEPVEALQWLGALTTNDDPRIAGLAGYFSAMSQQNLAQPELAHEALSLANAKMNSILEMGTLGGVAAGEKWWFDAAAMILIQAEAEQMILGEQTSPRPTTELLAANQNRAAQKRREGPESLTGQPVPGHFTLTLLEGGQFNLPSEENANILLLDFWATWCGPCRSMMPVLARISKDYADRGIKYVAVNLRETPDIIRNYLSSENLEISVALDTDGGMAEAFNVHGIPTMIVIDRNNIIRKVHVGAGAAADEELRKMLDELLNEQTPES